MRVAVQYLELPPSCTSEYADDPIAKSKPAGPTQQLAGAGQGDNRLRSKRVNALASRRSAVRFRQRVHVAVNADDCWISVLWVCAGMLAAVLTS